MLNLLNCQNVTAFLFFETPPLVAAIEKRFSSRIKCDFSTQFHVNSSTDVLVFMHIQKTVGTVFKNYLVDHLDTAPLSSVLSDSLFK